LNDQQPLPAIGDRVQIHGSDEIYVVVAVNRATECVSLVHESEIEQTPLNNLIQFESFKKG
jgi:hypothetical protein